MTNILGVSAGFHDASVSLVSPDGDILFAGHSERYSKIKNDPHLCEGLINDALSYGDVESIAWYESPWIKKTRELYSGEWNDAVDIEKFPHNQLKPFDLHNYPTSTYRHHLSHAAAGFQTSPYDEAVIIVADAIGEWDSFSMWIARYDKKGHAQYELLERLKYPNSIGLFYSAVTQYLNLKPNEDEYITMGLAGCVSVYNTVYEHILRNLFSPSMDLIENLHIGLPNYVKEALDFHVNNDVCADVKPHIACAAQRILEDWLEVKISDISYKYGLRNRLGTDVNYVYMGGVALNCVANTKLSRRFNVKDMWIMPNPGDAGSSLGAAALKYKKKLKWHTPYLGHDIPGEYPSDDIVSEVINNHMVGVASGRAEFGPRALGNRSLLADPRMADIKDRMNHVKQRQPYRPFAPVVLAEFAHEIFDITVNHANLSYMQYTFKCKQPDKYPGIVHKDGTSRVQVVTKDNHPGLYDTLWKFYMTANCPVLLNTSLNIKGEPIVNDVSDSRRFERKYGVKVLN